MLKLTSILLIILPLIFPNPSFAQNPQPWSGRCVATVITSKGTFTDIATIQGVECLVANLLQFVTYAAGVVFLFMFISGGFSYLFSSNDPKKVAAAGATLTSAFIGLIGIVASWFILRFIANFTGIPNLTNFVIPGP
jgi:hypothetical protein